MSKRGLSEEGVDGGAGGAADGQDDGKSDKRARNVPSTALVAVDTSNAIIMAVRSPVRHPSPYGSAGLQFNVRMLFAAQGARTSGLQAPVMQLSGHGVRAASFDAVSPRPSLASNFS